MPGGFDMFHIGHLNILRAARERCDRLVVGVATDASLMAMKGRAPVIPLDERMEIVSSLRFVDEVVADVAQDKRVAWRAHPFDVLFKGT
ncbi:adenylyltransferase/cytidyltransferase family protein, partial [Georgenia ruanii]|nr:adenylyltransferase/cytidyltransferase family protein [Georgenia ruanii]